MTGMTPERLAEIRALAQAEEWRWDHFDDTEAHRAELLDEVDRLRAGIEALCRRWRGSTNPALYMERDLRALLSPTEQAGGAS